MAGIAVLALAAVGAVAALAVRDARRRRRAAAGRVDEPDDALRLGMRRHDHGDVEGTIEAFARADRGGDRLGAFNLGVLLGERGEAADAYDRALRRGDADEAAAARAALVALRGQVAVTEEA